MKPSSPAAGRPRAPSGGDRFADLPPRARIFVGLVTAIGAAVLAACVLRFAVPRPSLFILMAALAPLTSTVKLRLPLRRDVSTLSVSNALTFAALLLLGAPSGVTIGVMSAWSQCTFRMRSRNPLHRTLFSMATVGISAWTAAHAIDWVMNAAALTAASPSPPLLLAAGTASALLRAVLVSALLYFIVNSMLVATAVALTGNQPIHRVWLDGYLWSAPGYFVAAFAGYGVLHADRLSQAWGVLLAVPLYLTYRSYRSFIARIEDERAQVRLLSDVQLATIEALALAVEVKDHTSQSHIQRFQIYAEGLARALRLDDDDVRAIKTAALLHDIGNLAVPEHILGKPGDLSTEEFLRLQVHPRVGADIVSSVPFPYPVSPLILSHHEHWDGSGYPHGLAGDEIPIGARILTTVDFFTAQLANRPYRPARAIGDVIAMTRQHAGTTLDPSLVETFLAILPELEQRVSVAHADLLALRQASGRAGDLSETALEDIASTHREAKALYEIAQALGSSLGLDDTFRLLADKLKALVPFTACALYLPHDETGALICRRAQGLAPGEMPGLPPMRIELTAAGLPAHAAQATPAHFTDALAAPLAHANQPIGAIAIYHTAPEPYGAEHRRLLDLIAQHAAPVLHNSIVFERTQEASLTDPLTGLANRRALQQVLADAFTPVRHVSSPLAVLLLDLDGLKAINDSYGHHVGDRAIREVAGTLRANLRRDDLCARYAGDEYVVVLPGCDWSEAVTRATRLQSAVGSVEIDGGAGRRVRLSISVGAAAFPEDGWTPDALVALADERMYVDKARRRDPRRMPAGRDAA